MAIPGLNHRTGTTTAFIRKADIQARFALSAHRISNRGTTSLPPLVWTPILGACAETSLPSSESRAGAPPLNCCGYSGQVELAVWRQRWWLTFNGASLRPAHVECDVRHFLSVTLMYPVPWTGSATGIAPCQMVASLIEPRLSPCG